MNTQTKNNGVSFMPNKITERRYIPTTESVKIGKKWGNTAAQLMTLIAYGDCNNNDLPVRSLDYNVQCEDFNDLLTCLDIISGYNEFDAELIKRKGTIDLNQKRFYNAENVNNGNDLFKFWIGREGSPVIYVALNTYTGCKRISDKEKGIHNNEEGEFLYYEDYTGADFEREMRALAAKINADEFSIDFTPLANEGYYKARFWWD